MATTRLQRIEKRRKVIQISAIILGIVLIIGTALLAMRLFGFYNKIHTKAQVKNGTPPAAKDEYTLVLLGYGGGNHEGTYLTDTIMVANINVKTKKVVLISIPRDIWVKIPTTGEDFHAKINSVYQMGLFPEDYPALNTKLLTQENPSGFIKQVVNDITGLSVDSYAAVDFDGFIKVIDILGGVDIAVERSFTDYEYPIEGKEDNDCDKKDKELEDALKEATQEPVLAFPCRYETLHFNLGETHMDGATALKYARSRHALEDGGDFNRAQRQQNVLDAVKNKVLSIGFIPKIIPLIDELEEHIKTDMELTVMNKLLLEARNADDYKVSTLVISGDYLTDGYSNGGQYIIIPRAGEDDWKEIQTEIYNMQKGISPTPTKKPSKVSPTLSE